MYLLRSVEEIQIQIVKWYYSNQKEAEGPVAENILRHLIEAGVLPGDTLIWREGEDTWQPAHQKLTDMNLDPFHPPKVPEKKLAKLDSVDAPALPVDHSQPDDWRPVIETDSGPPAVPLYSDDNHGNRQKYHGVRSGYCGRGGCVDGDREL